MLTIVKYYAEWCGPCKALDKLLDAAAEEYNFLLEEVNIEEQSEDAREAGVRSIPVLVFKKEGKGELKLNGLPSKDTLYDILEEYTANEG